MSKPITISTFDCEWLGGFFDGEGSVSLQHGANGQKNGNKTFRLQVRVGQKNRAVVEALKRMFGGCILETQTVPQWSAQGPVAENFLRTIRPFTVLKNAVIDLALEYRELMKAPRVHKRHTPATVQRMSEIRSEIIRLNALD